MCFFFYLVVKQFYIILFQYRLYKMLLTTNLMMIYFRCFFSTHLKSNMVFFSDFFLFSSVEKVELGRLKAQSSSSDSSQPWASVHWRWRRKKRLHMWNRPSWKAGAVFVYAFLYSFYFCMLTKNRQNWILWSVFWHNVFPLIGLLM